MGTHWDDAGLHWHPVRIFPWIETAYGYRQMRSGRYWLVEGRWWRWRPKVIEQCDGPRGEVFQTIQLKDGTEQVRRAYWLE